jgi:hypothetical protein
MKTVLLFIVTASLAFSQLPLITFTRLSGVGRPRGINVSNAIVGTTIGGDEIKGLISQNGAVTNVLIPSSIQTIVHGIENNGRIVGAYFKADNAGSHGFLYFHGDVTTIDYPGATSTTARAINNPQTVVGDFKDANGVHGFSYREGTFTQIDVPGAVATQPTAINNPEDIVGYYIDTAGFKHGFLLSRSGTMQTIDVPFTGATDTLVTGINAPGILVGSYIDGSGTHGFVDVKGVFVSFDAPDTPPAIGTLVGHINDNGSFVVFSNIAFLAQVQ